MTKQEEILDFIIETLQQRVGVDHAVDLIEDGKIHVCGEKYHFTIDLLDVVDKDLDAACENITDNVVSAFTQQFSGHSVDVDEDGNVVVSGDEFNFSVHLADVKTLDDASSVDVGFDFDSVLELGK